MHFSVKRHLKVSCCEELLYLLTSDLNIHVLNMNGHFVKNINFEIDVQGIRSFVVHMNKVLCLSKVASCFNLNGELLWQGHMNIGRQDGGIQIAVDNWGNCYIPSDGDKNIIVISNDGKQRHLIFPESQHLTPRAVYFDKKNNRLIVLTDTGVCKVFNVTLKN